MKDNALRDVLIESGTIKLDDREGATVLQPVFLEDKIDAIAKFLGIKFQYVPERIVAKKKDAPQENKEDSALRTTE